MGSSPVKCNFLLGIFFKGLDLECYFESYLPRTNQYGCQQDIRKYLISKNNDGLTKALPEQFTIQVRHNSIQLPIGM